MDGLTGLAPGILPQENTIVHFSPDDVGEVDLLNITPEVDALTGLLASRECQPPLTLGIFGDWGAGKTFFMRKMMAKLEQLRDQETGTGSFISGIVQIRFNAWHYLEANVMSALAYRVFEAVSSTSREDLLSNLETGGELQREALAQLEKARDEKKHLEAELRQLSSEKANVDLESDPFDSEEVQNQLAIDGLNLRISALSRGVQRPRPELLRRILDAEFGLIGALGLGWTCHPWSVAVGGVVGAAVGYWVSPLVGTRILLQPILAASAGLSAAGIISFVLGRSIRRRLVSFLAFYENYEKQARLKRMQSQDTERAILERQRQLKEAEDAVQDAQTRVQPTSRSLAGFIEERISTSGKRTDLGLITKIRADFEKLSTMLIEQLEGKVRRIIVYIDDLDRCPPSRVVEVLTASHLLLGFPLFIVVLAADARWISRSLEKNFPDLLGVVSGPEGITEKLGASATSLDYLEKIVHLPVWLKPLDEERCRMLTNALLAPDELSREEREYIPKLAPLLGRTPRTVKRFLNVYRLLRGGIPASAMDDFLKTSGTPRYKVVTLLLALVSGEPELAALVIQKLQIEDKTTTIREFINLLDSAMKDKTLDRRLGDLWARGGKYLKELLINLGEADNSINELQNWASVAQRHSFLKPGT